MGRATRRHWLEQRRVLGHSVSCVSPCKQAWQRGGGRASCRSSRAELRPVAARRRLDGDGLAHASSLTAGGSVTSACAGSSSSRRIAGTPAKFEATGRGGCGQIDEAGRSRGARRLGGQSSSLGVEGDRHDAVRRRHAVTPITNKQSVGRLAANADAGFSNRTIPGCRDAVRLPPSA